MARRRSRSRSRSRSYGKNRNVYRDLHTRSKSKERKRVRKQSNDEVRGSRSRSWSLDSLGRKRRKVNHRDYNRSREKTSRHYRSRSRSPSRGRTTRRRSRDSPSKASPVEGIGGKKYRSQLLSAGKPSNNTDDVKNTDDMSEEEKLKVLLGFNGFDTTKGKVVIDNVKSAAVGFSRKDTKREYRQYMNRRGGFNRPLDS